MLQVTAQRVDPLTEQKPLLICNEDHRFIAAEQMRGIDTPCEIILEPVGRNTAPAVGVGRAARDPGRRGRAAAGAGGGPPDPRRGRVQTENRGRGRPSPRPGRWSRSGSCHGRPRPATATYEQVSQRTQTAPGSWSRGSSRSRTQTPPRAT